MCAVLLERPQFAAVPPDVLSDDTRIPLGLVDAAAHNPRAKLVDIEALAASIEQYTLLQPIVVRRVGGRYQLIGGHRRVAAYRLLHQRSPQDARWTSISAVVRRTDDDVSFGAMIAMQVQSQKWTAREEATALETLAETRTLREVGEMVNRSESWAGKRLKTYSDSVLSAYVQTGRLTNAIAEELLSISDIETKRQYAERAASERWSQARARSETRRMKADGRAREFGQRAQQFEESLVWLDRSGITPEIARRLRTLQNHIGELLAGSGAIEKAA